MFAPPSNMDPPCLCSFVPCVLVFPKALREGKRCVTAHWLNTVLKRKVMVPPHRTLHVPFAFPPGAKPCSHHVRSTSENLQENLRRTCGFLTTEPLFSIFCPSDHIGHGVCGRGPGRPEADGLPDWRPVHRIPVQEQHGSHLQTVSRRSPDQSPAPRSVRLVLTRSVSPQVGGAEVREGQGVEDPLRQRPVAVRHPAGEL